MENVLTNAKEVKHVRHFQVMSYRTALILPAEQFLVECVCWCRLADERTQADGEVVESVHDGFSRVEIRNEVGQRETDGHSHQRNSRENPGRNVKWICQGPRQTADVKKSP
jgi:hypothetical protein